VFLILAQVVASADAAENRITREYVLRRAQEVAQAVEQARGLTVRAPIRADVLSRTELVELVRRRMEEETPPEEIRAEGALLERLGIIASAADYEQLLYDMFEQQVAGLYDPDDRTTYVLDDLWPGEADLTLWHEIVHALQDQDFHVGDRQDALDDDGDRSLAYSAVCEGDATITSLALQSGVGWEAMRWMLPGDAESMRSMFVPAGGGEAGVPTALLEVLSFPYVEGVLFVRGRWESGGLAAVDELFRRPPESTEQVIHPEKYRGADTPVTLDFREEPPPFPGRTIDYEDTMGEFITRVWLGIFLPAESARKAAEGWGGDRIALLVPHGADSAGCAAGATPLDDRLWACGASPQCGADAEVRLAEAEGWVAWATVWDPAPEDHPLGSTGEADEFWEAAVGALRQRLRPGEADQAAAATADAHAAESAAAGSAEESPREVLDPAAQAGTGEADRISVTAASQRTWTGATERGVAASRQDGIRVQIVLGPPGRAAELPGLLDELAAAVEDAGEGAAGEPPALAVPAEEAVPAPDRSPHVDD
jgi:hypothetical protein